MKKSKTLKLILTALIFFAIVFIPTIFNGTPKSIAYVITFVAACGVAAFIVKDSRRTTE